MSAINPYYADEWITLYQANCLERPDLWGHADVLVTDPPYGMNFRSGWRKSNNVGIEGDRDTTSRDAALQAWGDTRPWLMFGTWSIPRPLSTRQVLIWHKDGAGPGMGNLSNQFGISHEEIYLGGEWPKRTPPRGSVLRTLDSPAALAESFGHPTPKPVGLMSVLVAASEGIVADPFAGSGSTLIAAKELGRRAIGIEVDERYCEIAARRLSQDALTFGDEGATSPPKPTHQER